MRSAGARAPSCRLAGLGRPRNGKADMPRCGTNHCGVMLARTAAFLLIAVLVTACSGCIALEKVDDPDPADPGAADSPWSGVPESPHGGATPVSTLLAPENANVVVPVDPVPVQPGELLPTSNPCNVTSVPLTQVDVAKPLVTKTKVFEDQYSLTYSAAGLQVDVVDVPFIITFSVNARHPESGAYSRLVVTVRDAETLKLVADEGYNGTYGSAKEKSITLYRPGRYIVTLDGHFVDVKVTMATERTSGSG